MLLKTATFLLISTLTASAQTYFAEVDAGGNVLRVIVADQAFIDSGNAGDPSRFVEATPDGKKGKNFPSPGYTYNSASGNFSPPKPYPSWVFSPATAQYDPPEPMPARGVHNFWYWDESKGHWMPYSKPGD